VKKLAVTFSTPIRVFRQYGGLRPTCTYTEMLLDKALSETTKTITPIITGIKT